MKRVINFRVWHGLNEEMIYANNNVELAKLLNDYADIILMQNTGLKDSYGKDIYEGDILKSWYSRDTSGKDIIEFTESVEFEVNQNNGTSGFDITMLEISIVIGNIYENPKLLK